MQNAHQSGINRRMDRRWTAMDQEMQAPQASVRSEFDTTRRKLTLQVGLIPHIANFRRPMGLEGLLGCGVLPASKSAILANQPNQCCKQVPRTALFQFAGPLLINSAEHAKRAFPFDAFLWIRLARLDPAAAETPEVDAVEGSLQDAFSDAAASAAPGSRA
ncbi:MAG: hypothetical protein IH606_21000 [Burkholderiales bacterium]|nr:hypothetical protein [Burkholderiales bacterium]